jgi:hypothetical protein
MSSYDVTLLIWALLAAAVVALDVAGRFEGSPIPTLSRLIGRAMRSPQGRIGILAGWLWVGLHYFSR